MTKQPTNYHEFWPYYLAQHTKLKTRQFHLVGLCIALIIAGCAIGLRLPLLFLLVPVAGYGPAWYSHFYIEHNRPATFRYPVWSLISDFRMAFYTLRGETPPQMAEARSYHPSESSLP